MTPEATPHAVGLTYDLHVAVAPRLCCFMFITLKAYLATLLLCFNMVQQCQNSGLIFCFLSPKNMSLAYYNRSRKLILLPVLSCGCFLQPCRRESLATVVVVRLADDGGIDMKHLEELLKVRLLLWLEIVDQKLLSSVRSA